MSDLFEWKKTSFVYSHPFEWQSVSNGDNFTLSPADSGLLTLESGSTESVKFMGCAGEVPVVIDDSVALAGYIWRVEMTALRTTGIRIVLGGSIDGTSFAWESPFESFEPPPQDGSPLTSRNFPNTLDGFSPKGIPANLPIVGPLRPFNFSMYLLIERASHLDYGSVEFLGLSIRPLLLKQK